MRKLPSIPGAEEYVFAVATYLFEIRLPFCEGFIVYEKLRELLFHFFIEVYCISMHQELEFYSKYNCIIHELPEYFNIQQFVNNLVESGDTNTIRRIYTMLKELDEQFDNVVPLKRSLFVKEQRIEKKVIEEKAPPVLGVDDTVFVFATFLLKTRLSDCRSFALYEELRMSLYFFFREIRSYKMRYELEFYDNYKLAMTILAEESDIQDYVKRFVENLVNNGGNIISYYFMLKELDEKFESTLHPHNFSDIKESQTMSILRSTLREKGFNVA